MGKAPVAILPEVRKEKSVEATLSNQAEVPDKKYMTSKEMATKTGEEEV